MSMDAESAVDRLRALRVPDPLESANQSLAACQQRLQLALDLCDEGVEIMRANLHRRHPHLQAPEIERLLCEWLQERPGAECGDGWGEPVPNRFE